MAKKALLMILDRWGIGNHTKGDVIFSTPTPYWDYLVSTYPNSQLQASGENVGLPDGQMGNSEVGHTNIGAGRVVYQELTRITKSISDGDFFEKKEFLDAIKNCKDNNTALHLIGLLSDGGVHSHITHLIKLVEMANLNNIEKVYIYVKI